MVPDWVIKHNKNRQPVYTQKERTKRLEETGIPDCVIPLIGNDEEHLEQIIKVKPDVYCFSEDQNTDWIKELKTRLCDIGTEIKKISRYKPDQYSTTKLHFSNES